MKVEAIKHWSRQILKGLHYMHSLDPPVIHRDIKLENIFINGNSGQIKIGDLGLAKTVDANIAPSERTATCVGTPEYMAPELYDGAYDTKVDIWSFGLCVLELLTHEFPYEECKNMAQIFRKVHAGQPPAGLDKLSDGETRDFVEACIRRDPNTRPTAEQLQHHPFLAHKSDMTPSSSSSSLARDASGSSAHLLSQNSLSAVSLPPGPPPVLTAVPEEAAVETPSHAAAVDGDLHHVAAVETAVSDLVGGSTPPAQQAAPHVQHSRLATEPNPLAPDTVMPSTPPTSPPAQAAHVHDTPPTASAAPVEPAPGAPPLPPASGGSPPAALNGHGPGSSSSGALASAASAPDDLEGGTSLRGPGGEVVRIKGTFEPGAATIVRMHLRRIVPVAPTAPGEKPQTTKKWDVTFKFHLGQDNTQAVAEEMTRELQLAADSLPIIQQAILCEVRRLVDANWQDNAPLAAVPSGEDATHAAAPPVPVPSDSDSQSRSMPPSLPPSAPPSAPSSRPPSPSPSGTITPPTNATAAPLGSGSAPGSAVASGLPPGGLRSSGGSHQQLEKLADNLARGVAAAFGTSPTASGPLPLGQPVHPVMMAAELAPAPVAVHIQREGRSSAPPSEGHSREPSPVSPTEGGRNAAFAGTVGVPSHDIGAGQDPGDGRVRSASLRHWVNPADSAAGSTATSLPPLAQSGQQQQPQPLTSRNVAAVVPVQEASQQVAEWRAQHAVAVLPPGQVLAVAAQPPMGQALPAHIAVAANVHVPTVRDDFSVQWPEPPSVAAYQLAPAALAGVPLIPARALSGEQVGAPGVAVAAAPAAPSMTFSEVSSQSELSTDDLGYHRSGEVDSASEMQARMQRQSMRAVAASTGPTSSGGAMVRQASQNSVTSSSSAGELAQLYGQQTPVPSSSGGQYLQIARPPPGVTAPVGGVQYDAAGTATSPHGAAHALPAPPLPLGQHHHSAEFHGYTAGTHPPSRLSESNRGSHDSLPAVAAAAAGAQQQRPGGQRPAETAEERAARDKKALEQKILLLSSKQLVDMDKSSETLAGKAMKREGSSMSVVAAGAAVGAHIEGQPARSTPSSVLGASGHHDPAHIRAAAGMGPAGGAAASTSAHAPVATALGDASAAVHTAVPPPLPPHPQGVTPAPGATSAGGAPSHGPPSSVSGGPQSSGIHLAPPHPPAGSAPQ